MVTLEEITLIQAPIERCFDLARSVEVHLVENVHCAEAAVAISGVTTGLIGMSQRVAWRARHFGVRWRLANEVTAMEPPAYFQQTMVQGAFRSMKHDHFFRPLPSGQTEMKDVLCFAAPTPVLGRLAEIVLLRRYMRGLLHERNVVIKRVAESSEWRTYLPSMVGG